MIEIIATKQNQKPNITEKSTSGSPPSARHAKTAENDLAFANDVFAKRTMGGLGQVVPFNVFHLAAAVANEMVMSRAFRIVPGGASFDGHLTNQTRLHQIAQVVISCGSRRTRIRAIHRFKCFRSGRMGVVFQQERHHSIALGSAAQSPVLQGTLDGLSFHKSRLYLI